MRFLRGHMKDRRAPLTLSSLLILSLLTVAVVHGLRTRASSTGPHLPELGAPIGICLRAAGLDPEKMGSPYGALIFLGGDLAVRPGVLVRTLEMLSTRGVEFHVFVPKERRWAGVGGGSVHVVEEKGGEIRARFGLRRDDSAIVLFQRAGALWGASRVRSLQFLERELRKWSQELTGEEPGGIGPSADWAGMRWVEALARFPFDSLARHAKETAVDLDRLPRGGLRVRNTLGDKEAPAAGEPVFSLPTGIAVSEQGWVNVADPQQRTVFVLSSEGELVSTLGQPGEGPGEMSKPVAVSVASDGTTIVAESCCLLHEFATDLRYLRTIHWPVEFLQIGGKRFGTIGMVALVGLEPLPPVRTNVVHLYRLDAKEPCPIASFMPYAAPRKRFRDPQMHRAATASRNMVTLGTDGRRYLALCRAGETQLFLWDLQAKAAWRMVLKGKRVETRPSKDAPVPPYATISLIRDIAFDFGTRMYALVRDYGVVEVELRWHQATALYTRPDLEGAEARLAEYWGLAAWNDRLYLLSPGLAHVAVCSVERPLRQRPSGGR